MPFECRFLTENIIFDIFNNQKTNSDQERLENFVDKVNKYQWEMQMQ